MDFGDLQDDKKIKEKLTNFHNSVEKLEGILEVALNGYNYNDLNTADKVNYDLFITFTLNTLYWMYLRTQGQDPNNNDIKNELSRVKEYMLKAKQAKDRNTIRPKIDQGAAKRFIKHGINHSKQNDESPPKRKKH